jgi:lipopolysaccharide export system protein LptC
MSFSSGEPQIHGPLLDAPPSRRFDPPTPRGIARRRMLVNWTKRLLPLAALALLGVIAFWPQLSTVADISRVSFRRVTITQDGGKLSDARYRGVDERGRPYAVTAVTAVQVNPERVNLTDPKADILLESGAWLLLQSREGVYMQHQDLLDMSGDVTLYRDDGTTLRSKTATMNLKAGMVAGADTVSAEGPFGTLDATGYTLVDKGDIIQFSGPARLVLNGASH